MLPQECIGCAKIMGNNCQMYNNRAKEQWSRIGGCAGRTHNRTVQMDEKKFKVNPIKASKKSTKR
jgi:hypothetical protein